MRKKITFLMAISAMLFLGALSVNAQNHKTISEELSFNCLKADIEAADWITYTTNNYTARTKCVEGEIPNLSGPARIVAFSVSNCESFTITGDGNKAERFLTVQINDGDTIKTESWPDGCSTQTFQTGNTGEITISIAGVSGSVYLANVTFKPSGDVLPPSIESFEVAGVSAAIDQTEKTITATLPFGTDITALTPTVTTGGSATGYSPAGAQNFTNPVVYTVTDGTNNVEYTVTLTVQAVSPKELTELIFSNSFNAFIVGEIVTAYYMAGQEAPTIKSYKASEGASVALSEDKSMVVVTGSDNSTRELTLTLAPVTPFSGETPLKFDGSEAWIKTRNAFDASKGWVFSKDVEEESNKRISEGKSRVYFFVGNYEKLTFTSGTASRAVKVYINGVEQPSPTATAAAGSTFDIALSGGTSYMVEISSNKTNGDGGVTNLTTTPNVLTSVKQTLIKNVSFDGKTIQNPNNIKLNVFDISGRRVITSNQNIEMSGKHSGIYIVTSDSGAMKINVR